MAAGKIIYSDASVDTKAADIYWDAMTGRAWILAPGNGTPTWAELSETNKNVWREQARHFFDLVIPLLSVADTGK